ncbi:hypothetical protein COCOBI_04-5700 [Coccomyxa sp. Obi]|nr:hypothetical protein COCOBI_04-5700 [Coccomyxa sp. Obi]
MKQPLSFWMSWPVVLLPLREVNALQTGQCRCCVHKDADLPPHVSSWSVRCQAAHAKAFSVLFFGVGGTVDFLGEDH